MRQVLSFVVGIVMASVAHADWPVIPAPSGSRVEQVGEQVRLNGVPMRMQRVLSAAPASQVMAFYRSSVGERRAEERLSDGWLISQGRGDYFLTVRVKALSAKLTESLVSVSDARAAGAAQNRPLGFAMPADTQVVSDMESLDAGKASRQLVAVNAHSMQTNVDFFSRVLRSQGFSSLPEREPNSTDSRVIAFGGADREARLVVVRKNGASNVVLTMVMTP